jgi:hypothetical protein
MTEGKLVSQEPDSVFTESSLSRNRSDARRSEHRTGAY